MIRVLLFLVALSAGAAAFWVYLERPQPAPMVERIAEAPAQPEMVLVLAATRDMLEGERVTPDAIAWIGWPQDFLLPSFITRDSQPEADGGVTGWLLREAVSQGEPLRRGTLRQPGPNPISALLGPGMRALAVRVSIEATAGGFIMPGDRVDVLKTIMPAAGTTESRIVASNVRVIALDQFTGPVEESSILVERTATLELDRSQVERVAAAEQTGSLSLALRALADETEPPEFPPPSVRILRGGQRVTP